MTMLREKYMNKLISPPFEQSSAIMAIKYVEQLWNDGKLQDIGELFCVNCQWRDNERHLHGKEQIMSFLKSKTTEQLHNKLTTELWNYSFYQLVVSFQSEWQNSKNGQWYRIRGHGFIDFGQAGLITEFRLSVSVRTIFSSDRVVHIN